MIFFSTQINYLTGIINGDLHDGNLIVRFVDDKLVDISSLNVVNFIILLIFTHIYSFISLFPKNWDYINIVIYGKPKWTQINIL